MADLVIPSLEGGLSTKSPTALLDNQCAYALNVEFWKSKCGERRNGMDAITFTGSGIENADRIVWVYRHMPTNTQSDAQLWALGLFDVTGSPTAVLVYKTTSWNTVSVSDAFTLDGASEYQVSAQTLHGKLFIAYNSSVDRLHCWDGTSLRRVGLGTPAAPTAADTGGAGAITAVRYYRVRYTVQSGGTTLRRSEPSASLTYDPNNTASVTVTKPATISEGETHWELERSSDNVLFYVIATTVVGTTTHVDSIADATPITTYTLSEDVGDYTVFPSVKYLTADNDRLIGGGAWESASVAQSSRVTWSPVFGGPGVGNDERWEADTDPYRDLDNYLDGPLTGLSEPFNGTFYATKLHRTYQFVRTGDRDDAYEAYLITAARGALPGSIVTGVDNKGQPSLFALDPDIGPIRIGGEGGGVETCGTDLIEIWNDYRATAITSAGAQRAVYVPEKKQVQFWIPGSGVALILHTQHMRLTEDGFRGGWTFWQTTVTVYAACLFSTNVDDGVARNLTLRPFLGISAGLTDGFIFRTDTGTDDNGTAFTAAIQTRDYNVGNYAHDVEVKDMMIYAQSKTSAQIAILVRGLRPDYGVVSDTSTSVSLAPNANTLENAGLHYDNGLCMRHVDNAGLSEIRTGAVAWQDGASNAAQWAIEAIALNFTHGTRAG
jgi:hypothetical protein